MANNNSGYHFATWTSLIEESQIRALLKYKVDYYFGGGKPGIMPTKIFGRIMEDLGRTYQKDSKQALDDLNYGPTSGEPWFKKTLAKRLHDVRGIPIDPEDEWNNVSITSGSQQALYALVDTIINPGDVIITPSPSYLGFLVPAVKLGARVVTVPTDLDGMLPEYVEKAVKLSQNKFGKCPDIVYVVSDSDNPKGTTLPWKRRQDIFDICESENILIVEDSAYAEVQFKKTPPAIKTLDKENERVAYLGTTSKEAAVLRVGYSVLPQNVREQVLKDKGYLDLCTSTFVQRILDIYYKEHIDEAMRQSVPRYKERAEAMAKAIDSSFPAGARTDPTGGFFIWWQSEEPFDSGDFMREYCLPNDIIYVPGEAFYPITGFKMINDGTDIEPSRPEVNTMRLGFSYATKDNISKGIEKLGGLLSENI
jgi:2-aminoadipate transaminase